MFANISFINIILRIFKRVSDISRISFLPLLLTKASQTLPIENKAMITVSAIKNANIPLPMRDNITNEYTRYMHINCIIKEGNNLVTRNLDFSSYLTIRLSVLFAFVILQLL